FVVISPITMTNPVVVAVSQATRLIGSFSISASKIASEMASHILSGWPSVTDSEVNNLFSIIFSLSFSFAHSGNLRFSDIGKGPHKRTHIFYRNPLIVRLFAQVGTFRIAGLP